MTIQIINVTPFQDQQPGTSGLRKPVSVFQQSNYSESFIQSIFNVMGIADKTIIIGGDGRFYNEPVIQIIIAMAAAQKVTRIIIGETGLLSTPAASYAIKHYHADYGIILSASHNPGGAAGDFGIKINLNAGQPAPQNVTEAIFNESKKISSYQIAELQTVDLSQIGRQKVINSEIQVISATADYVNLMQQLFDFPKIKTYLRDHPIAFDAMHAVTGPYALAIFHEALGLDQKYLMNIKPMPDFAGHHPDPQPSQCQDLFNFVKNHPEIVLGAASDGDGDRNLITGREHFINPCDSLAIIADQYQHIPCLKNLSGVGRTLPTTRAIDMVCAEKSFSCYETPTGWKFFANLLDNNQIQLCGEESFGTSGNHIREKDGLWAILCWLNLMAAVHKTPDEIIRAHWQHYGRVYFNRYDFIGLEKDSAESMLQNFEQSLKKEIGYDLGHLTITHAGQFNYNNRNNDEVAKNQGLEINFGRQARIVCRLSGTDTRGSTLRIYCEYWQQPSEKAPALIGTTATLVAFAQGMMNLKDYCHRSQPDNIV